MLRFSLAALALGLAACDPGDVDDILNPISIDRAQFGCDTTASTLDDQFYFEAWTDGPVVDVDAVVEKEGVQIGQIQLTEQSDAYWYGEEWADTMGTDCDELSLISVTYMATGDDNQTDEYQVTEGIEPEEGSETE